MSYAIVYLRPDGWWVAGTGWTSPERAEEAAERSSVVRATWKVVKSKRGFRTGSIVPERYQASVRASGFPFNAHPEESSQ